MSRTDKTKPLWVRHAEHGPQPIHDHSHGHVCDLPPGPAPRWLTPDTRCRWEDPGAHLLSFKKPCCAGCKRRSHIRERQDWAKAGNRRDRYAARLRVRRYLTGRDDD
ncbi:hypothetical protein LG943_20865 [Streptomonospora sp. S1-112]|uniref:Uncharacterized protein n=1 Tax=Streptomonospora mangrovi TaxID=2883123 RepID=A0A9X3SFA2_9ACTN|nr:hypothetical protein [Streptomonospora mangrovi]MDA0566743.1 hypothetical protein [Streptomonospora mangrovi]